MIVCIRVEPLFEALVKLGAARLARPERCGCALRALKRLAATPQMFRIMKPLRLVKMVRFLKVASIYRLSARGSGPAQTRANVCAPGRGCIQHSTDTLEVPKYAQLAAFLRPIAGAVCDRVLA